MIKTTTEAKTIFLGNEKVHYTLRRSTRAKRFRLEFWPDSGLMIVVPHTLKERIIEEVLQQHQIWIKDKIAQIKCQPPQDTSTPLTAGTQIPFLGKRLTLTIKESTSEYTRIYKTNNSIVVTMQKDRGSGLRDILLTWFKEEARRMLTDRAQKLSSAHHISYHRISIRDQKTRWASCSRKHNLNFNWRLVMAPLEIIDYVVLHELAHLIEMNHSDRFWHTVEDWCPDYRRHRQWLKKNGPTLKTYIA
ncbi:MAG: SprT family zinc-dependent metalloprotease [Chloroflexota bacterium]|nr:SprT family zinc-dependent metalloprotease [Chloroflexota bacterium]